MPFVTHMLRELLTDDVKRLVSMYLYDPTCYDELMRILECRYGNPDKIIHTCLKSIEALPSWRDFDLPGLQRFSDELQGVVTTLSLGNHQVEIESAGNLMAVVKKMPERLRDDWGRNEVENYSHRRPNLRDLSDWLEIRKEAAEADVVSRFEYLRDIQHELSYTRDVTILIGIDNPLAHEVFQCRTDPYRKRSPHATLTPSGWCLVGPYAPYHEVNDRRCFGITLAGDTGHPSVSELLERFFEVDIFGIKPSRLDVASPDERRALRILETTTRFTGERYEAGLLWRFDDTRLPDNRQASLKRFYALERRLIADPYLAAKCTEVIEEYLRCDHAKVLTVEEANVRQIGRTWYLPYHPVFNPNKPTKLRVVFDAAAMKWRNVSLNSELLKGPDFLANLIGVLLRFRRYRYAVTANIVKMFHQVRVRHEDVSALRFFWRKPGTDSEPSDHQMNVKIFGATSSPSICAYALRRAAKDVGDVADLALSQIVNHFYVDN
uniref:Uncharacterized protein n=1 Tax=Trichuris muris TaxID=70415 RepID=A0A5S6Q5X3_TRIMR